MLTDAKRPNDVLTVIEADSGVRLADLTSSERFGPRLTARLERVQVDSAASYVASLVHELSMLGHAEQADSVVDWYLRGYRNLWHVPENGDPAVRHVIPLLEHWLRAWTDRQPDFAWRLCGQAVAYLRHSLLLDDLKLADRREFIAYVEQLRTQIRRVSYTWTEQSASAGGEARVLQAQLWDAELSQRALFEEFLLTAA